jgi:hypothetical protein
MHIAIIPGNKRLQHYNGINTTVHNVFIPQGGLAAPWYVHLAIFTITTQRANEYDSGPETNETEYPTPILACTD